MSKSFRMLSLLLAVVANVVMAKEVVYRCDFTKGTEGWQAWCEHPENHISTGTAVVDGQPVLDLKGKGGWLTPVIFKLPKPVLCTEKTMLHFKIWANEPIECDINIGKTGPYCNAARFLCRFNKYYCVERNLQNQFKENQI